ncbi:Fc.00g060960.m01.CDS01 [Cosmosporella sp. VM-42]
MVVPLDGIPLRIFATSRPNVDDDGLLRRKNIPIAELHTGQESPIKNITAYVAAQPKLFSADEIVSGILKRFEGVFLLASAIITERLDDLCTVEDMRDELRIIPPKLNDLWKRILNDILWSRSGQLAKCILTWMVCSSELMSAEALRLYYLNLAEHS